MTNRFEDRFGRFSLFAQLADGNLWQKGYNRYFKGRLGNYPINDYDRDARTDFVIVRGNTYYVKPSSGLPDASFGFGSVGDAFLPAGDIDGDRIPDAILRQRDGAWHYASLDRRHSNGPGSGDVIRVTGTNLSGIFGTASDRPVPGDYDGDWVVDKAVFRPSNGTWYASLSSGLPDLAVPFGIAADRAVPGDYDGDGKTDPAVFRPSGFLQ